MKKVVALLLSVIMLALCFAGCTEEEKTSQNTEQTQTDNGDFAKIVDKFKETILPMDSDGYIYSEAVQAVCDYVNGEKSAQEAADILTQSLETLEQAESEISEQPLDDEFTDILLNYDIMPEEFELFTNFRIQDLSSYIEDLNTLYSYLQLAEDSELSKNNVNFVARMYRLIQENNRDYYFYANINYWFVNISDEEREYLFEELEDQLKWCSISQDEYVWENDAEIVEDKSMEYLDIYEDYLTLYAEYLGLAEAGGEETENIFSRLDALEEKYIE